MGGLFDDIFDDDDFEIKEEECIDEAEDAPDDWHVGPDKAKTWNTGKKPDIWNADEPWTCDDDCSPDSDCGGCDSGSFDVDDFFN